MLMEYYQNGKKHLMTMAGQGLTKKDQGHFDLRKHHPISAEALNTYIRVPRKCLYEIFRAYGWCCGIWAQS